MALEKDFELVDDYLSNRMDQGERAEFEKKIEADPELKQEFQFQQNMVEAIRAKRVAELKSMLNNVPVSSLQPGTSAVTKIVASILITGVVATGAYFFLAQDEVSEEAPIENTESPNTPATDPASDTPAASPIKTEESSTENTPTKPSSTPENQPKSNDLSSKKDKITLKREHDLIGVISKTFITSSTEVVTESGLTNYSFHYAFKDKKLVLYGSFEINQYQILEFITADEHIFFLNYKSKYYLLDDRMNTPTPLQPISDPGLQKKLREFRTK